jgi:hypothetical protein
MVQILALYVAIISHIWAEAFALTVNLTKQGATNRQVVKMVLAFCLVIPLGIVAGMSLARLFVASFAHISQRHHTGNSASRRFGS